MIATNKYGIGIPISSSYNNATFSYDYIDYTKNPINISGDAGIKKNTQELMQQATFTGWNFITIWGINEGTSYPYLKLLGSPITITATNIRENSIALLWTSVNDALEYDLEVDGEMLNNSSNTTYIHSGLLPGTEHTYRVRSRNALETSPWSNLLTVVTLFPGQIFVTLDVTPTTITASWNGVPRALSYEIEVDGSIINNGLETTYIHNLSTLNAQHTYRVRAKTDKAASPWSATAHAINWSVTDPGICIAETNWVNDIDQNVEVVVKANNISDIYTSYLILQFDPLALKPDTQSITNLAWPSEPDAYIKYAVYWETGKVKILISRTGETLGSNGQFDIVKLTFKVKTEAPTQLSPELVKFVDSLGVYRNDTTVQPLSIRIFRD